MAKVLVVDRQRAERADVRLLVVPHAGAGAAAGVPLAQAVPENWCVGTVRFAGRESRFGEPPGTFDDQLREVTASAADYPGSGPLVVVGACSGAALAVVAARADQLTGTSRISGCVLLSRPGPSPDGTEEEPEDVSVASLVRMGGVDERLLRNEEFLEIVLPVLKADLLAASRRLEVTPRLTLPLLALRGRSDTSCSADNLASWALVAESLVCDTIEGGHFLLDGPAAELAQALVGHSEFLISGSDVPVSNRTLAGTASEGPDWLIEVVLDEVRAALPEDLSVSPDSNFFDLGGDSLLALELTVALQDRLRVDVELVALYEAETLLDYAAHLQGLLP